MTLRNVLLLGLTGALLLSCKGDKGDPGEQGPQGVQGPQGTPGTTTFGGLTDVPAALLLPFPAGASSAIVSQVVVSAAADCGSISPAPRLEVYVDGQLVGGTDVTNSTFADTAAFPINPTRYAHEIAIAFPNDNQNGSCDHNLHVQSIKVTTAAGVVTIPANSPAHVIYDRGGFFDNIDVLPATPDLGQNGALRFFLAHTGTVQGKVTNVLPTGGGLPRTGNFTTSGGTIVVLAHAGAFGPAGSTIRVDLAIDGTVRTSLLGYTNEASSHKALPGTSYVLQNLPAGSHTLSLSLGAGQVDNNDYSQVTVIEMPF